MHPDLCHMGGVGVPVRAGGAPAASVWRRGGVGCNQLDRGKEKVKVPNLCAERTFFGGCVNTALFVGHVADCQNSKKQNFSNLHFDFCDRDSSSRQLGLCLSLVDLAEISRVPSVCPVRRSPYINI